MRRGGAGSMLLLATEGVDRVGTQFILGDATRANE